MKLYLNANNPVKKNPMKQCFLLVLLGLSLVTLAQTSSYQLFPLAPSKKLPTSQSLASYKPQVVRTPGLTRGASVCDSFLLDYSFFNNVADSGTLINFDGYAGAGNGIYTSEITSYIDTFHSGADNYAYQSLWASISASTFLK
jgi:hypothetical protein